MSKSAPAFSCITSELHLKMAKSLLGSLNSSSAKRSNQIVTLTQLIANRQTHIQRSKSITSFNFLGGCRERNIGPASFFYFLFVCFVVVCCCCFFLGGRVVCTYMFTSFGTARCILTKCDHYTKVFY